jgi:(S)-ureidoglycine aminohydrolase
MNVFGFTRSSVRKDHALIAPDSFVHSSLPGWDKTEGIILISLPLGARFTQYLALMAPGGSAGPAQPGIERVIYVIEGEIVLPREGEGEHILAAGGYAYIPPNTDLRFRAQVASRLNVFEKRFVPLSSGPAPGLLIGQEQEVEGVPFLGDSDASLKTLLPGEPAFDLAVNLFTFVPGATLPMVEVHMMEHGLLMLQGQGVYRLADAWYPVQQGEVIWMAPYCPQWFVAMGKTPARYLYYKDVNRDPFEVGT